MTVAEQRNEESLALPRPEGVSSMDMDIDRFNLNISSPKIWASERTIVGALVELHVSADRHDGVRYRVGLVLVALRLVVVEALVVLHSRDGAQGQKMDQEGKYVPGREAHVWPSAAKSLGRVGRPPLSSPVQLSA